MTKKRATAFLAVILSLALATPMAYGVPLGDVDASGAPSYDASGDAPPETPPADGKVPEKDLVNPEGTSINLFDYWFDGDEPDDHATWTQADANVDSNLDSTIWTTGINDGHIFKFAGKGMDKYNPEKLNSWTGNAKPHYGIVKNTLVDGFPVLADKFHTDELSAESLAYLFNANDYRSAESAVAGKKAHIDVKNLLQIDDEGYYYYQSADTDETNGKDSAGRVGNFASYNEQTNAFDLYASGAVRSHHEGIDRYGMFFPFNSAEQVFQTDENGNLKLDADGKPTPKPKSEFTCAKEPTNHFFGLSMTTRFAQTEDGMVEQGGVSEERPVTYEFAGDDDVWVFIDGVLVGDLGGRHDAASLKIDFSTGKVIVNEGRQDVGSTTTLKAAYEAAGRADRTQWNGDTFADDTIHTLRFFYLERGAYESNLQLKFNFATVPTNDLVKVDQYGLLVGGATFELWGTDESYDIEAGAKAKLITTGTTDEDGNLVLLDQSGLPVSFDEWHMEGYDHFLLKETVRPGTEYRLTDPLKLKYQASVTGSGAGFVVSENTFDTGAVASAKVLTRMCAAEKLEPVAGYDVFPGNANGEYKIPSTDGVLDYGTLFAVPMKFTGERTADAWQDPAHWKGVYGDPLIGWDLSTETGVAGAIEAAKEQYRLAVEEGDKTGQRLEKGPYEFALGSNVIYELETPPLPGDIRTYLAMLPDDKKNEAEYSIAYYWTAGRDGLAGANEANTFRLKSDDFTRLFAANLSIPNVYNRVAVQKVDQDGNPVKGATFGLFESSAGEKHMVDGQHDGTYRIKDAGPGGNPVKPIVTVETRTLKRFPAPGEDVADGMNLEGAAVFDGSMDPDGAGPEEMKPVLEVGKSYYIAEVEAPEGFELNPCAVHIFVSDEGVFADAGIEKDGVKVFRDVGMLLHTVEQYAENPAIDATLHDVVAQLQTVPTDPDETTDPDIENIPWQDRGGALHLTYNRVDEHAVVDFAPTKTDINPNGGDCSPLLETDTDWSRVEIVQCLDHGGGSDDKVKLDGDKNLSHLFSGLAVIQVTDERTSVDPGGPDEPNPPVDPDPPVDPPDPEDPNPPVDPPDPEDPNPPVDPPDPDDPDEPNPPTDPEDPDAPFDPDEPGSPENPDGPDAPGGSDDPSGPGNPEGRDGGYAPTGDAAGVLAVGVALVAFAAGGLIVVALRMRQRR